MFWNIWMNVGDVFHILQSLVFFPEVVKKTKKFVKKHFQIWTFSLWGLYRDQKRLYEISFDLICLTWVSKTSTDPFSKIFRGTIMYHIRLLLIRILGIMVLLKRKNFETKKYWNVWNEDHRNVQINILWIIRWHKCCISTLKTQEWESLIK